MRGATLLAALLPLAWAVVAPASDRPSSSQTVAPAGAQVTVRGPAEYFTGNVRVEPLFAAKDTAPFSGASVTFEPGARSAWHTHPAGQHLIVTSGLGRTQEWGGPVVDLRAGDVVWCPPGVKHWHGAAPTTAMTHIALTGTAGGKNVDWLEKVSDEQYGKRGTTSMPAPDDLRSVAPALEKYRQDRLLGDLWKRPGLTPRDRSIVTIAALIARQQTTELPYHLDAALDHGVKPREISEIITHLAFYSGWGNAMSAVGVAREVFARRRIGADQLPPASPPLLQLNLPRDRSLVTVSALIASGHVGQIPYHLNRAMDAGLTQAQAAEVITHLAFHAGWPNAFSALPVAKEVFDKRPK